MSKAFTRESDDAPEQPLPRRQPDLLPSGAKNYLTASGAQRMRRELAEMRGDDPRKLPWQRSLASAVVVEPPPPPWDHVRFGATVIVRDSDGEESRYRIVGVDEVDTDRDWISWLSPLARALVNARLGETIRFQAPGGERTLEITAITYE